MGNRVDAVVGYDFGTTRFAIDTFEFILIRVGLADFAIFELVVKDGFACFHSV
jgi:hypothetical protein